MTDINTNIVTGEIVDDPSQVIDIRIPEGVVMPIRDGEDFTSLAQELNGMTLSRELLKIKQDLVGVMMILTSFTFREGIKKDDGTMGDYVSVEATTNDNRRVVFNDSSTGIRKQIVEWLTHPAIGVITLKEGQDANTPYLEWDSEATHGKWNDNNNSLTIDSLRDGRPIRYLARHGLQESTYASDRAPGGQATTYYLQ